MELRFSSFGVDAISLPLSVEMYILLRDRIKIKTTLYNRKKYILRLHIEMRIELFERSRFS